MPRVLLIVFVSLLVVCGLGALAVRQFMPKPQDTASQTEATVERGDIVVQVTETGHVAPVKVVEVRSRVSGRVARLFVDVGDRLEQGQLIAIIDPQETELRVAQDRAQLRGAQSAVDRIDVEIAQRRVQAQAAYDQALARLRQAETQGSAQPRLVSASVRAAEASLASAKRERERLETTAHPSQRVATQANLREAEATVVQARAELVRRTDLVRQGYMAGREEEAARLQLATAEARLATAKEQADRLEDQLRAELDRADASVRQAQAELDRARASEYQVEVSRNDIEVARLDLNRAQAALRDVEALLKSREQSRASVDQIQSVLGDSLRQLEETEIRAPISGVVALRPVQEGELVASLSSFSSGTTIVRIEDRTELMVRLSVNEIDVAKLTVGMEAEVVVDAFPDRPMTGRVEKIAPVTREASQGQEINPDAVIRFDVEVYLQDAPDHLKSGMSARCTMTVESSRGVLWLPTEFVGRDDEGPFVLVKTGAEEPEKRRPVFGLATGARTEIRQGLNEGDKVAKPPFTGPQRRGAMVFGPDDNEDEETP